MSDKIILSESKINKIIDESIQNFYEARTSHSVHGIKDPSTTLASAKNKCENTLVIPIPDLPGVPAIIKNNADKVAYIIGWWFDRRWGVPGPACNIIGEISANIASKKGWKTGSARRGNPNRGRASTATAAAGATGAYFVLTSSRPTAVKDKLFTGLGNDGSIASADATTAAAAKTRLAEMIKKLEGESSGTGSAPTIANIFEKYGFSVSSTGDAPPQGTGADSIYDHSLYSLQEYFSSGQGKTILETYHTVESPSKFGTAFGPNGGDFLQAIVDARNAARA